MAQREKERKVMCNFTLVGEPRQVFRKSEEHIQVIPMQVPVAGQRKNFHNADVCIALHEVDLTDATGYVEVSQLSDPAERVLMWLNSSDAKQLSDYFGELSNHLKNAEACAKD
ncbi:hypothetical protein NB640_12290 [Oxalobacter vibrioformis]|uniref:Uncharacterized protein n=1 Tax=Oxalobacter vibrioformis TaxID=933080 RepID=A0A9E9LUP3_9BURK|nr:hypothetical protein [Oxalobacter vibrioformis]WAW09980.1 hypothetical protein NB640_12290 [Oxalobacter vibrioformis]